MKISATILALLWSILLAFPATAKEPDPWKAKEKCILGMPYIGHVVKKGETGVFPELFKAIFEPVHIEFRHKELPYIRALEEVKTGEIQCTLVIKDSQKELPQSRYTLAFYNLAAAYLRTTGFDGVKSLKDKRVAYLHGFGLKKYLKVKFTPQQVYDLSSGFHMLDRGFVTYMLGEKSLLLDALKDSKLPTSDFEFTTIKTFEIRPIFTPSKEGRRLRDIYDKRMGELLRDNELEAILRTNGMTEQGIRKVLQVN